MANEIVADADAQIAATLALTMVKEARVGFPSAKFFVHESIEGIPTMLLKTSKHPVTSDAGAITDGTAMSNTAINPTSISITAAGVGLSSVITKFSERGSLLSKAEAVANFGRALINKMDVDGCANAANFSTTVGTTNTTLTIGSILSALYDIEVANETADLGFLLHPKQTYDLRAAIVASAAPVWYPAGNGPMVDFLTSVSGAGGADPNYKGVLFGVPVYSSTNVPTANAAVDRAGALVSMSRAWKWVTKWLPENESLPQPQYPGELIAVHTCYGTGEILDGAGVTIISKA